MQMIFGSVVYWKLYHLARVHKNQNSHKSKLLLSQLKISRDARTSDATMLLWVSSARILNRCARTCLTSASHSEGVRRDLPDATWRCPTRTCSTKRTASAPCDWLTWWCSRPFGERYASLQFTLRGYDLSSWNLVALSLTISDRVSESAADKSPVKYVTGIHFDKDIVEIIFHNKFFCYYFHDIWRTN